MKVFLDMDGVLVDFVGGLHRALGMDYSHVAYPYPRAKYEMFGEVCSRSGGNISMDQLLATCDPAEFWANLQWNTTGREIASAISSVVPWDDVVICTKPMPRPEAWAGKIQWLNKHLPQAKNITIMSAPKHLFAKPGHILIDDKDSNVESFREHGGSGFLIPQPWNSAHEKFLDNYVPKLKEDLTMLRDAEQFCQRPFTSILRALGC